MSRLNNNFVLFVPDWVTRILDREKISYNKLFNLAELRKHLSVEDLAIIYWMNTENRIFKNSEYMMELNMWTSPQEREYIDNNLVPLKPIAKDAIESRLYQQNNIEQLQANTVDHDNEYVPFKIINIADKTSVFVVIQYPGGNSIHQSMLITELLKLLYAHAGYDDMANNQLFKGYIERLALANNIL